MQTAVFNIKIRETELKIHNVVDLITTTVLDTKSKEVENEISNVTDLVKKTYYDAKISDIEGKFTDLRLTHLMQKKNQKELINESDISNLVKISELNKEFSTLTTKAQLKA